MPQDVISAIVRLRRSLSRAATAALSGWGVGPRQLSVLRELRQTGPLSQVELARSTATDPAGMMRTIDALEERGWVRRTSKAEDRRCKIVSLTPQGQRAVLELDATYAPLAALASASLTSAERLQFIALTGKLTAAFEAAAHSAPPSEDSGVLRTHAARRRLEHP
ncbi:MAG: MarR family transcriptional regulator [Anaeromyxobacteraceae bacterium]